MRRFGQVVAALTMGFVLVGVVGCGQDNEQAAQITGVAPETPDGGPVSYENLGKPSGGPPPDYPGAR